MNSLTLIRWAGAALIWAVLAGSSLAATIPTLFNSGVDAKGGLLPAGAVDPHYRLITSADPAFPGPDAVAVNQDFPISGEAGNGPWLKNGPYSKWIAPQPDQTCCGVGNAGGNGGNQPGDYVYRTTFDLTGFDLSTVRITGRWAVDSEGIDVRVNGTSTGTKIPPYPPQPSESWHTFTLTSGFVDGVNTLDFVVNRSSGKYPTGLRVELTGAAALLPPASPITTLYGTGLDANGALLEAGGVDAHYKLITSADPAFPGPDAIVVNQDFPIAGEAGNGPWLRNGPLSKWIGPQADQTCCGVGTAGGNGGNQPGDYVYRTTFDLTGFDLSTVRITGQWAVDSEGIDIKVNGASTGTKIPPYPPQPSESWHPFELRTGFVDGINTLDFVVNRSSGKYPTGLRVDISGTAVRPGPVAVPDLVGTGLGRDGSLLAAGAVDPHYSLITSADPAFPGPEAIVVNQDFPIAGEAGNGPWLRNGPLSKWIGPQADQTCCGQGTAGGNGGNQPGDYIYRTTFDLTGFDLSTVQVTGEWAVDSEGIDIRVNGTSTGTKIPPYPPQPSESWHPFTLAAGFVDGLNTLDFVVNRSSGKYPTGLRVNISASGLLAGSVTAAPEFLVQAKSQAVQIGANAAFLVSVKGSGLSYQWRKNGANIAGATTARLEFTNIQASDFGDYDVVVSNSAGSVTSARASLLQAVAIPGLFNTGVGAGGLLADGAVDTHYRLITSADANFPGPDTFVVLPASRIAPDGTWAENGPDSRWIAPQADQTPGFGGNAMGSYVYRLSFDLGALDPDTAIITGNWAAASALPEVRLNGQVTGLQIGPFQPALLLRPFTLNQGFVSGVNTLDFTVVATGSGDNSTGLRVELRGTAGELPPNTRPSFLAQPQAQQVLIAGDTLRLSAAVRGSAPITYQWRRNGANIAGATTATLVVENITVDQEGVYDLVLSNSGGHAVSQGSSVTVLLNVPGLFNTGVDNARLPADDGAADLHYRLITNPNDPGSNDAIVLDSLAFPLVAGPWVLNSESSKWIGATIDPNGVPGDYIYRTTFRLDGFDPSTVQLLGRWAVDDRGVDIRINGVSSGAVNTSGFGSYTPFVITSGFVAGLNTVDFVVNNGDNGQETNPTGLRIDGLRAGGKPPGSAVPALAVTRSGADVIVSWPASATGFALESAPAVGAGGWTAVTSGIVVSGSDNTYRVQAAGGARFFRLKR